MYILGISCYYHDASAVLLKDGIIVAAIQEERLSRKKHDSSFPLKAIQGCLEQEGITMQQVECVAFYEKPFLKFERVLSQQIEGFPFTWRTFVSALPSWINEKLRVPKTIRQKLGYEGDVFFVHHHMAHAASSFLFSPFDEAAILTVDGVGEWTTTAYGMGRGTDIELTKELKFPHSVGLLYSTITAYLGFSVNNSEYKVMGLAGYGDLNRKTNPYYKRLLSVLDLREDGSFAFDMSYFKYHYSMSMPSRKLCRLLEGPIRKESEPVTKRHKDLAAAVQLVTEDILDKMLHHLHKVTKCDNVVLSGGVALNSLYNGKILQNTPFKKIWIHPDAGDGGTSAGAAAYAYHVILKQSKRTKFVHPYLGPSYSGAYIRKFLENNGIIYKECKDDNELVTKTAKLIKQNNVIGWFQEGMEWGPRALGARSIISNPCAKDMQAILNLKVKHREKFRPFAPVVCAEDANTYFECDSPIPEPTDYMLMVYPIRNKYRELLPAVTHVDGTGRLQTIRESQNSKYYHLVKEFGKLSGIPILINTSFNIRGEPIVCTPEDAYRCMMGTGIDYLVMDRFIISSKDNNRDKWDSEVLAHD